MPEKPNRPPLKWLLLSSLGIVLLGMAPVVWYMSLPNDFHVGQKLKARGFLVEYDKLWRHPYFVEGKNLIITPEDCQLISQLPHLVSLYFVRSDMSGLNLDEIGNCQQFAVLGFDSVTQFSANELRKLAKCPIRNIGLLHVDLKDSDLEILVELPKLCYLNLRGNIGITDAGFEYLEKISSLTLYLQNTSVTQEGVAEFRKKRPDVEIVYTN